MKNKWEKKPKHCDQTCIPALLPRPGIDLKHPHTHEIGCLVIICLHQCNPQAACKSQMLLWHVTPRPLVNLYA